MEGIAECSVASVARSAGPIGLGAGLVFWFASLTPTLVPRGWIVQGVTSGICLAIGYAIGATVERAARRATRRAGGSPGRGAAAGRGRRGGPLVGVVGALAWATWQDEARDLVGMSHLAWWEGPPMVLLSAVVGTVLVRIGSMVGAWLRVAATGIRAAARVAGAAGHAAARRRVRRPLRRPGGGARVRRRRERHLRGTGPGDQSRHRSADVATVSGSPSSLVAWETMGLWGRDFAAGVTSRDQLLAYHGQAEVRDPIRVFVGMRTAEYDRGARRPSPCASWNARVGSSEASSPYGCPAGSGWMDPNAARALELLHAGDTAIVSTQYSYLPSFFSLVIDSSQAIEAGAALFEAVHERWSALPEQDRPRLIVFGASLGAGGAESPFVGSDAAASVANFASRADGALIVGSLGWNPILRQLTEAREPGSPAWQPIYAGGETVRFLHRR